MEDEGKQKKSRIIVYPFSSSWSDVFVHDDVRGLLCMLTRMNAGGVSWVNPCSTAIVRREFRAF